MGRGRSGKASGAVEKTYDRLPFSTLFRGYATDEGKAQKRAIIKEFMSDAKVGNVYRSGSGVGSGGEEFEIVSYNRSPNKMGIRSVGSGRTVALNSQNVTGYIKNGATLLRRSKKR